MSIFKILVKEPTKAEWESLVADMRELSGPKNAGQYQHNMISMQLRRIAGRFGMEIADRLIEKCRLAKRFGIEQQIPQNVAKAIIGDDKQG